MPDARGVIFKRRDDLAFDAKDAELLRSADLAHYLHPFTDYKALAQERSTRLLARVTQRSALALALVPGMPVFAQVKGVAIVN